MTLARQAYQEGRIGFGLLATLRGRDRAELAAELRAEGITPDVSRFDAGDTAAPVDA